MTCWFISDTHFNHYNIIKYCNRPFADQKLIDEHSYDRSHVYYMDLYLEHNWNKLVEPEDEVWFLGDFCFYKKEDEQKGYDLLDRLNGIKHLVRGNHDPGWVNQAPQWESTQRELYLERQGIRLFLCHYPYNDWEGKQDGVIHLHGHTHGKTQQMPVWDGYRLDMGVDCWNYRPVSLDRIVEMKNASETDPGAFRPLWLNPNFSPVSKSQ